MSMDKNSLKKLFWETTLNILKHVPWAIKVLKNLKIIYVPSRNFVACINEKYELIVSDLWMELAKRSKRLNYADCAPGFVLVHEVLHILMDHVNVMKAFCDEYGIKYNEALLRKAFNIGSDAVVNYLIEENLGLRYVDAINILDLCEILGNPGLVWIKDSVELSSRIIPYIEIRQISIPFPGGDLSPEITSKGEGGREEIINEGNKEVYRFGNPPSALRELLKSAGSSPAWLDRFVFTKKESQRDWTLILRSAILFGARYRVVIDWKKPSRRGQYLPSHKKIYHPNIWCLVDVSASINEETFNGFFEEILSIVKSGFFSNLFVIPWDVEPKSIIRVSSMGDIVGLKVKGFGGTRIEKTLRTVARRIRHGDIIVILTDGYIGDVSKTSVKRLFYIIRRRAKKIICVTTGKAIPYPIVHNIRAR